MGKLVSNCLIPRCLVGLAPALIAASAASPRPLGPANDHLTVRLDADAGYAFSQVTYRASGVQFIQPPGRTSLDRSPWLLTVRGADGSPFTLTAADANGASHETTRNSVRVTWQGVGSEACPTDLSRITEALGVVNSGWHGWR